MCRAGTGANSAEPRSAMATTRGEHVRGGSGALLWVAMACCAGGASTSAMAGESSLMRDLQSADAKVIVRSHAQPRQVGAALPFGNALSHLTFMGALLTFDVLLENRFPQQIFYSIEARA